MGFQNWLQGLILVTLFLVILGLGCFFIALWGSKMINDLGNAPTKSAQIQMSISWKILIVEVLTFSLLIALYSFLNYLNT